MPEYKIKGEKNIIDILVEIKLVSSKTEAKQLIKQGGVKLDGEVVSDVNFIIPVKKEGSVLQKGKRGFVRIIEK